MSEMDRIYNEPRNMFSRWGLQGNPFTESASSLGDLKLQKVFTGREDELKEVFTLFHGGERKRILVYGRVGIGKTAFIRQVLSYLRTKEEKDTLVAYITLPPNTDLATASFIALAREMKDDNWAQKQLNLLGLCSTIPPVQKRGKVKAGIPSVFEVEAEETSEPVPSPRFPALSFEDLLERALKKYKRVVIGIDDLDKQDPARVRELLRNDQGLLKSGAWFMLSGHPSGLTRDLVTSEMGLFDYKIELRKLNNEETKKMLINYLNSVRIQEIPHNDPEAVKPFTPETARNMCERSHGIPRWLNRFGNGILIKAITIGAEIITDEVLQQGVISIEKQLRGQQGLTPEDLYILDFVIERGGIDDAIELEELKKVKAETLSEILPILDKLVQYDLLQKVPSERVARYEPSPFLSR